MYVYRTKPSVICETYIYKYITENTAKYTEKKLTEKKRCEITKINKTKFNKIFFDRYHYQKKKKTEEHYSRMHITHSSNIQHIMLEMRTKYQYIMDQLECYHIHILNATKIMLYIVK